MTNTKWNINNKFAAAFLIFYVSFLIFAAFHTHKINIQCNRTFISGQTKTLPQSPDPFLDRDSKCQLYNFTTNKFILSHTIDLTVEMPEGFSAQQRKYANLYLAKYYYNFDLRAPPLS